MSSDIMVGGIQQLGLWRTIAVVFGTAFILLVIIRYMEYKSNKLQEVK